MAYPDFDLLGDPIPPNFGKRGRPPHTPTDEKRRLVIQLLAFDWSLEKIAAALNCTPPTLRKHYFRELRFKAEARARTEAKLIGALMKEAEAGNVSAIDKYFKRFDRHDLHKQSDQIASPQPSRAKAEPKLGKKEERRLAAENAAGIYAPPAAPLLN